MFFKQIAPLLSKGVKLKLEIAAATDNKIEVNVFPVSEASNSGHTLVPTRFVASAEELDADFTTVMGGYANANLTLKDQLAAVDVLAAQVAKEAAADAVKPAAKRTGTKVTSPGESGPTAAVGDDGDTGADEQSGSGSGGAAAADGQSKAAPPPAGGSAELPFQL